MLGEYGGHTTSLNFGGTFIQVPKLGNFFTLVNRQPWHFYKSLMTVKQNIHVAKTKKQALEINLKEIKYHKKLMELYTFLRHYIRVALR